MPRVALIHALRESIVPLEGEFAHAWPACERMNLLDDSLSADLARAGRLTDAITERFLRLGDYAVASGAEGILFSCSAFGPCIEAVARRLAPRPVLKPNEAMIAEAMALGGRLGLVATFEPTLDSMPPEFPKGADLRLQLAKGALDALRAGDLTGHDAMVAEAAAALAAEGCTAVILAQFSAARAAPAVAARTGLQVLTTLGSAVRALRERLGAA